MKTVFFVIFIITSFLCKAQSDSAIDNDYYKRIFAAYNIKSIKQLKNNTNIPSIRSLELRKIPEYDLFYDSLYIRQVLFNDFPNSEYNKFYDYNINRYINNPVAPYGNFESALICGSINYLIFLLEKK